MIANDTSDNSERNDPTQSQIGPGMIYIYIYVCSLWSCRVNIKARQNCTRRNTSIQEYKNSILVAKRK